MLARRRIAAVLVVVFGLFVAACGSSNDNSSSGGGGGGGASTGEKISGAKVIDAKSLENPPKGTVKYCQGKDTTGSAKALIKDFNAKFGAEGYKAVLTEFPASADQQRTQFIQRQQAKSDDCDVFSSDVIWTAEFASQKWLYDLTPYVNAQKSKYIGAPLETVHYGGSYWGVPETSDAAFIYYRTDKGSGKPPDTWQQVYADAKAQGGLVYQGAPYEGLTCDYLELAFAAGGTVLSDDGKKSTINSPENIKALQLMVDGIKSGAAPKAVTTYMEPETDQAWTSGKLRLHAQLDLRLRCGQQEPEQGRGQVQGRPAADLRGRRQGRHPRRPQQRHQRLHEEPGPGAEVRGLLRVARRSRRSCCSSSRRRRSSRTPTAKLTSRRRSRTRPSSCRRSARQRRARCRRSIRRSRRRSTRTSTTRSPVASSPADALKKADSQINSALSTF